MCNQGTTEPEKTERQKLEEALTRVDALAKEWCEDGKRIIAAARKHLSTLPKPLRKVRVKSWALVGPDGSITYTWSAPGGGPSSISSQSHIVELTGEYDSP